MSKTRRQRDQEYFQRKSADPEWRSRRNERKRLARAGLLPVPGAEPKKAKRTRNPLPLPIAYSPFIQPLTREQLMAGRA